MFLKCHGARKRNLKYENQGTAQKPMVENSCTQLYTQAGDINKSIDFSVKIFRTIYYLQTPSEYIIIDNTVC